MNEKFPSPIGELHFSINRFANKCHKKNFRPLSGSYISQSVSVLTGKDGMIISVPYRGATFLNHNTFSIIPKRSNFRPLSGSYISQ